MSTVTEFFRYQNFHGRTLSALWTVWCILKSWVGFETTLNECGYTTEYIVKFVTRSKGRWEGMKVRYSQSSYDYYAMKIADWSSD